MCNARKKMVRTPPGFPIVPAKDVAAEMLEWQRERLAKATNKEDVIIGGERHIKSSSQQVSH